jgi:heme oxygenase
LDALRAATARAHRELEEIPLNARLLAPDFTLDEYREILARMYGFYEPLAAHARASDARFAPHAAGRAHALAADLGDLGYDADQRAQLPRCSDLPQLDSADRALGCAYVFEGAALGGRVILRHLTRLFERYDDVPFRFFTGDGDRTAEHWKAFCAELCTTADDFDEVCAAAAAAFDAMGRWLALPAVTVPER